MLEVGFAVNVVLPVEPCQNQVSPDNGVKAFSAFEPQDGLVPTVVGVAGVAGAGVTVNIPEEDVELPQLLLT